MIFSAKNKIMESGNFIYIILLSFLILPQLGAQTQTIQQDFDGSMTGWTITQGGSGSGGDDNNNASITGTTWKVTRPSSIGASLSAPSSPYCIIVGKKDDEVAYDYFFSPRIDDVTTSDEVHVSFKKAIYQAVSTAVNQGSAYIYTLRDINGNGIPEPLGADASGLNPWNGYYASSSWSTTSEDITTSGDVFIGIRAYIPSGVLNTGNTYLLVDDLEITITKAITISKPSGGEQWQAGTVQTIKWTAVSDIDNVNIFYTTDGSNYNTIATNVTASSGSYSWTVPDDPSTTCQIIISSSSMFNTCIVYSNEFTILGLVTRSITVTEPNGGERYAVGSTQKIRWTSTGVSNVKIWYDYGLNGDYITTSTLSDGEYTWTIPDRSGEYTIRITDVDDSSVSDDGNGQFEIYEDIQKSITVTSPNGGESYEVGSQQTITWTSTDVNYVNIYGNFEDGSALIASQVPSDGSYSWTVPDKPGACTIEIYDASDNSIYDTSDASFTIISAPQITIIYPNGGEEFNYEDPVKIKWSAYRVSTAKIDYSTDAGSNWQNIAENVSDTFYVWNVPSISSEHYLIKVTSAENASVFDVTDNQFSVTEKQPSGIVVLRENDAEGIPVHLNEIVSVSGIVTASDQFGNTGPAFIQDDNAGVALFGTNFVDKINIGDSITIGGTVTQYNGLTEIKDIDYSNIQIHRQGIDVTPRTFTISEILSQEWNGVEHYEGLLIQVNDVCFVETGTFTGNTNYHITDGTNTLIVRIDPDVEDIAGKEIPSGAVAVSGISGQFKSEKPYDSGYQIMPRFWTDIHTENIHKISETTILTEYVLKQNYPNPFNPVTVIEYSLPEVAQVYLNVYNVLGEKIMELVNKNLEPGTYQVYFDGNNLPSGIYIYSLITEKYSTIRKMILVK